MGSVWLGSRIREASGRHPNVCGRPNPACAIRSRAEERPSRRRSRGGTTPWMVRCLTSRARWLVQSEMAGPERGGWRQERSKLDYDDCASLPPERNRVERLDGDGLVTRAPSSYHPTSGYTGAFSGSSRMASPRGGGPEVFDAPIDAILSKPLQASPIPMPSSPTRSSSRTRRRSGAAATRDRAAQAPGLPGARDRAGGLGEGVELAWASTPADHEGPIASRAPAYRMACPVAPNGLRLGVSDRRLSPRLTTHDFPFDTGQLASL